MISHVRAPSILICLALLSAGCASSNSLRQRLEEQADRDIGTAIDRFGLVENEDSSALLDRVVSRLLRAAGLSPTNWRTYVLKHAGEGAFCFPGGKIIIFEGQIQAIHGEAELATVVGHEIAHCLNSDHEKRVRLKATIDLLNSALAVASFGDPALQAGSTVVYEVGAPFAVYLPFSRAQERAADRRGVFLMADACYNPRDAVEFWQRRLAERRDGNQGFWSAHPSYRRRLEAVNLAVEEAETLFVARCSSSEGS